MCRKIITDNEFVRLQIELDAKMREVEQLQKEYVAQTGRRFEYGQPIRRPKGGGNERATNLI